MAHETHRENGHFLHLKIDNLGSVRVGLGTIVVGNLWLGLTNSFLHNKKIRDKMSPIVLHRKNVQVLLTKKILGAF